MGIFPFELDRKQLKVKSIKTGYTYAHFVYNSFKFFFVISLECVILLRNHLAGYQYDTLND